MKLNKVLPKITESRLYPPTSPNLERSINDLTQCVAILSEKITSIISHSEKDLSDRNTSISLSNSLASDVKENLAIKPLIPNQPRFESIHLEVTKISSRTKEDRLLQIQSWLGQACKKIFSAGFSHFQNGDFDIKRVGVYCSQQLLLNLIRYIKANNLPMEDVHHMNQCLKNQILPYFSLKYPPSEDQANMPLGNSIVEKDNIADNQNDLVFKSKVQFQRNQDGDYNSQIMKFFNFIIQFPNIEDNYESLEETEGLDKGSDNKEVSKKTLANMFRLDMVSIFEKVQVKDEVSNMKRFNPIQPSIVNNPVIQTDRSFQMKDNDEKNQSYKQNVKSYTNYLIGKKISSNIKPFKQSDIIKGKLSLGDPTLMRIATKWCYQLQKNLKYENIVERGRCFRMKNGKQLFLKKKDAQILFKFLEYRSQESLEYLRKVQENSSSYQSYFARQDLDPKLTKFSYEEGIVGQFSSKIYKANQNYLLGYLNSLIHSIQNALADFKLYQQAKKMYSRPNQSDPIQQDPEKLIRKLTRTIESNQNYENFQVLVPQLVTFRVGDLLRCKCSSHKQEIKALYCEIERLSYYHPQILEVIRVKNRLKKGTKDLLINLKYRGKIVVEMQLAIKSDKSKFIELSDKFKHYLYELERAQFGPISQLCNIWINKDPRSQFYLRHLAKSSVRKLKGPPKHQNCNHDESETINLPFICKKCQYFYYKFGVSEKHRKCQKCGDICFLCQYQELQGQQLRISMPELSDIDKENQVKMSASTQIQDLENILPKYGFLVNLKAKAKEKRYFKTIKRGESYYLFEKNSQKQIHAIIELKTQQDIQKLFMQNLVFNNGKQIKNYEDITEKTTNHNYFIPKMFRSYLVKQTNSIAIVDQNLNEDFFRHSSHWEPFENTKIINFSQNRFQDISVLSKLFPNCKDVFLDNNDIQQIGSGLQKWKKIEFIQLSNNKISQLHPSFFQMGTLKTLNLTNNKIQHLPSQIGNLKRLVDLNVSKNKLTQIPDQISKLTELRNLNISINNILYLNDSILKLSSLQTLDISSNPIKELPESIQNLSSLTNLKLISNTDLIVPQSLFGIQNLRSLTVNSGKNFKIPTQITGLLQNVRYLDISFNSIVNLPTDFGRLEKLQTLICDQNLIQELPSSFPQLPELLDLHLNGNKIIQLPIQFGNLKKLRKLNISRNKLTRIPSSFHKLSSLATANFTKNQIQELPDNLSELPNLTHLILQGNKIKNLPHQFGLFDNLGLLNLKNNCLRQLPKDFGDLACLYRLNLAQNKVTTLPDSFQKLSSLKRLILDQNQIHHFPDVSCLTQLRSLSIKGNSLKQIPDNLKRLKKIQSINLQQNNFRVFPEAITELNSLKFLKLGNNNISCIPDTVLKLKNLKKLQLSQNQLDSFPPQISNIVISQTIKRESQLIEASNTIQGLINERFNIQKMLQSFLNYTLSNDEQ